MHHKHEDILVKEEDTVLTASEQITTIEHHFREIMLALGLDVLDDSLRDTPLRVAKMFVKMMLTIGV